MSLTRGSRRDEERRLAPVPRAPLACFCEGLPLTVRFRAAASRPVSLVPGVRFRRPRATPRRPRTSRPWWSRRGSPTCASWGRTRPS